MSKHFALVIDDEPDIRELLALTLGRMNIETVVAPDVGIGKECLRKQRFDLCLTDMRLPDGDGLELVDWMQRNAAGVPVAVITAHGNVETAVQALKLGAFDFITKPLDLQNLRNIVANALKVSGQKADGPSRLLGDSPAMQELRELIDRVARSQAPIHISGESGTGKELVARLIHDSGPRSDGPFAPVNCGAIPAELMESEFFGHRKGAFTGAVHDKVGLVQSANTGTLFLDEIADLPLSMQVKLLRVIQEQTVRPVGASREESVDVRILSATHRDLSQMVKNGEFREDLFYRINVIELNVPALRDRGQDILAAIAIPAYQDYTIRAQVSEGLNLTGGAKAATTEFYQDQGVFPANNTQAGLAANVNINGKYVSQVNVAGNTITVTYSSTAPRSANNNINAATLTMVANDAGGSVTWTCAGGNILSANAKWLPAACRP